jgi:hypothetical protein
MEPMNLFPKPAGVAPIHYGKPVLLLGSCFSEHLGDRLRSAGFAVTGNPFGVVFHPVPLARFVAETLADKQEERLLQRDDVWLSYDASSAVYSMSEKELTGKLEQLRTDFRQQLEHAGTLFITLGSAHGYRLKTNGVIVANCHKVPASDFEKELTETDELFDHWSDVVRSLQSDYPGLQIVFTVSPVRYIRDGWVENNRSKARLLELVERLQRQFSVGYFPAYELVNDVLRDYRYFEADGVHPNQQAVAGVWELFQLWYLEGPAQAIVREMEGLRRMESHRLLFPESVKSAAFKQQFHEKRESFLSLHPFIIW